MHHNNLHNGSYDIDLLCKHYKKLETFVFTNKYGTKTIKFSNSKAVKALNTALLVTYYNILNWEFPDENLCPPIPSRVDYIHHLEDLIGQKQKVSVLDIGTGATCIYPLLGNSVYKWSFVGTDIDDLSLEIASEIIKKNKLESFINLRLQKDKNQILKGIIKEGDFFDAVMCNPPFYKTEEEAIEANSRKQRNLKISSNERNFSGNSNELWYVGGEKAFLHNYLYESSLFKEQCTWFTSLVSKKENVKSMYKSLKKLKVKTIKTIEMSQGNKITRIVAWRFS
ncbi:MAG: 23S rRNA (adenine(1618)-N(6))-methyltransferase RlmF [Flavobacteriaceae bacterium]